MRARLIFAVIGILSLFPLWVLGWYAVSPGWRYPDLIPQTIDLRSFSYLSSQALPLLTHLGSSLLYSLATVTLTLLMCLSPAHHFARRDFAGKAVLEGIFLAPALVPPMTFSMGVHYLFIKVGLVDNVAGVIMVLTIFSYPYMLRALTAGYQAMGEEYELCAKNLGANGLTRIIRIDLPLLMPSIVAGGSVVFLVAFSEYFLVFLIGGGSVASFTGYLVPFLTSSDRSMGALLTLIFMTIPLALFFLIEIAMKAVYSRKGMY